MPKSRRVLVAVGKSPIQKLPRQDYDNIVTKYNFPLGMPPSAMTDPDFFNDTIEKRASFGQHPSIYGFLKGGYRYASSSSLQEIVNVFDMDDDIEIVTTDILVKKLNTGAQFIEYGHSEAIPDLPFFVKDSIIDEIAFENSTEIFKSLLDSLVKKGKKIYHIGDPLLMEEIS